MTYLSEVLADSPRHYWRLADPGGFYAFDIGSVPLDMMLNGTSPQSSPCLGPTSDGGSWTGQGSAYPWNQDGESLTLPITMECWAYQGLQPTASQVILSAYKTSVIGNIYLASDRKPHFQVPSAGADTAAPSAVSLRAWHHYVLTLSAGGAATFYVDAVQVATASFTPPGAGIACNYSIGGGPVTGASHFVGSYAEGAIYPSVLNGTRIAAHWNAATQRTQRPVYRGFGSWSSSTGAATLDTSNLDLILAAVRTTFA